MSGSPKSSACDTEMYHFVYASFGADNPEACSTNRAFSEMATLMVCLLMIVSYEQGRNMVFARDDNRVHLALCKPCSTSASPNSE